MKTPLLILGFSLLLTAQLVAQTPAAKPAPKATVPTATTATNSVLTNAQAGAGGELIYKQYCLTCHQVNGSGVPKLNPPLKGTDWVLGDKTRLINVILNGLQNAEVEEEIYDNVMPAHNFLTDQQIADVLTYVRSHFGNQASAISAEEVKTTRSATGK